MTLTLTTTLLACGLFLGMLLFFETGRQIGRVRLARTTEELAKGTGAAEAAVFGLMGLLIAFTFSGAAERFENRRHLVTSEVNAIGTAYLRLDLLPAATQPPLRELFRHYVDVRATTYGDAENQAASNARLTQAVTLQNRIWQQSLAAASRPDATPPATMLLLPALNDMIDITTTRAMATQNHPPLVVFLLLTALTLVGSLLIGYDTAPNRHRDWLHIMVFAGIMSLAVFVIIDLEFPRLGLIRVDAVDQAFLDLRDSMR